ncbi:hypothetical protein [Aquipuribacter hungaricus]|uniref:Integral membrane protein n=1 Tax=Aquipuribacter hungaricus TaxID=545624 RepID=A0ABV7WBN8_9MICO
MTGPGPLRAALVVAVVVGVSTTSHLLAGGDVPSGPRLGLAVLLVALLAALAGGRTVSGRRLALSVGAGQVVLHHGLDRVETAGHCAAHRPDAVAAVFGPTAVPVPCGSGSLAHAMGWDPWMVVAHVVATAVAVVLLRRGEAVLRAVVGWATRTLVLAVRARPATPPPAPPAAPAVPPAPPVRLADPVRGPPAPVLV